MDTISSLSNIAVALAAYFVVTISPGPANFAVINASLRNGKRQGLAVGAGIVSASVCWGIVAASGLSTFLSVNDRALSILKVLGGLYLCWMAYNSFRASFSEFGSDALHMSGTNHEKQLLRKSYLRGFIIHITNPKAAFAWTAIMTLGLKPDSSILVIALILTIGGCMLQAIVVSLHAFAFSTKRMMEFYTRSKTKIESVLGTIFAMAGIQIILSAFNIKPLIEACKNQDEQDCAVIDIGRVAMIFIHLLLFVYALTRVMVANLAVWKGKLTLARFHRLTQQILISLLGLLLSGFLIIYLENGSILSAVENSPLVLLKLICVAMLCLFGLLLYRVGYLVLVETNRMSRREAFYLSIIAVISTSHWFMVGFIGVAIPLDNYPIHLLVSFYIVLCFITFLIGAVATPYLQQRINMNRAKAALVRLGIRSQSLVM